MEIESIELLEKLDLNVNNVSMNLLRFQIDGSSSLHYFALSPEDLSVIMDFFEEERVEYLLGLLSKNRYGLSPLHIAVANEAPKSVEIMLSKISLFNDLQLSSIFFELFPKLFEMKLVPFNEYLETCFF